ncbi:alpha/beta hydrolase [Brevibacillus migulae]|uniref:alpha/beta hydrolase n=1 Tax=Brevibacillus migulae TaxID=1644114 RepID=UPI001430DD26|nr:alpha/beta hydrolase [Brevibacillus migulae]
MERIVIVNSRKKKLVGHLYPSSSGSIIIMAHGFTSDKSLNGRFDRLASAFVRSGFHVLTFDFSGCGESDDERISVEREVDDLQAVIDYAKARGFEKIALYGHSLGSLICLKCYRPDIVTMVLSGALTDAMHYNWEEYFRPEQLQELHERGYLTVEKETGPRKQIRIDQQMLLDFEQIHQQELLKPVRCPVLIIHGNHPGDEEELLLLERSQRAMALLSPESKLEVIEGATHRFLEHMDVLTKLADDWFCTYLKSE